MYYYRTYYYESNSNKATSIMNNVTNTINQLLINLPMIKLFFIMIINLFFASAVAKDAGYLYQRGYNTILVPGIIWALATLIGGLLAAAIYWVLHHSNLTKSQN